MRLHPKFLLLSTLSLSTAIVGCAANSTQTEPDLLTEINLLRSSGAACGATRAKLAWNEALAQTALQHSQHLASKGELRHIGEGGKNLGQRVSAHEYAWSHVSENLAYAPSDAAFIAEIWATSAPHLRNLCNPNSMEFGAAQAEGYWTAVFATPKK